MRASTLDALVQVGEGNSLGGGDATETAGSDKSMMLRKEVMTLEAILMAADSTLEAREEEFGKFYARSGDLFDQLHCKVLSPRPYHLCSID